MPMPSELCVPSAKRKVTMAIEKYEKALQVLIYVDGTEMMNYKATIKQEDINWLISNFDKIIKAIEIGVASFKVKKFFGDLFSKKR